MNFDPRKILRDMFDAAIAAAQPERCVADNLPEAPKGKLIVLGAGKASAAMAHALEAHWPGPLSGLVITRYGYSVPCKHIEIVEAAHPVPDAAGLEATRRLFDLAKSAGPDDTVLCLISGGGSALMTMPLPGISLADIQNINRQLLACGAPIGEMNCIRRHLSAIKGGRLAAAIWPARTETLLISDVPGDDPTNIASGPTVGDATTSAEAMAILQRYHIPIPAQIADILTSGKSESIKPDDPCLKHTHHRLIAAPQMSLEAAAEVARKAGFSVYILSDAIEGEARDVGTVMAALARQIAHRRQPFSPPCILLSGGETTVTVRGKGCGGRNVEFLLSMGVALAGEPGIWALAGDTDGVDGAAEIAGAILTPDTRTRAFAAGINPQNFLNNNDGHGFFKALGDSVVTGPTRTNVNDFRAVLITGEQGLNA